jgi:predicted Zn-ribbon and HTH transcriptional regulator
MGSIHEVSCDCGYHGEVTVGGGRSDFRTNAPFPYYCKRCGLVEANTAKNPVVCPTCSSEDIHQYGKPPVSTEIPGVYAAFEHFSLKAYEKGNLCPACKKMTLVFDRFGDRFD